MAAVSENKDSDILTFAVDHGDSTVAERIATAYAGAFTAYKLKSDTASLARARMELDGRLRELRGALPRRRHTASSSARRRTCTPEDGSRAGDVLVRDSFVNPVFEFAADGVVEFHLNHGDWVRILRAFGFTIAD